MVGPFICNFMDPCYNQLNKLEFDGGTVIWTTLKFAKMIIVHFTN